MPSPPHTEKYYLSTAASGAAATVSVSGSSSSLGGGSGSMRRKSGLRSRATQLLALRFGWVVLVIWFEVGEFFSSLSSCKFPDALLRGQNPSGPPPAHIVLVADPHVPHPVLSHPADSPTWLNALRQAFDELFMRKSWNVVMRLGRIDGVIMLGDMLDTGRGLMTDADYDAYYKLYASIFAPRGDTPVYHVPGNHDIPIGPHRLFSQHARERYTKHFSAPNEVISIANHSIVLLDSVGLVEEDYRRYASEMQFGEWDGVEGGVIEFVKSVGDLPMTGPRILVTHIPLARPEGARCGPHREHGRIQKGAGPGYQNLLGSETSRFLLEELKPSIVFSGDDHDYCEFTHAGRIREVSLKSFSSSTGIRRPGIQLLSLVSPAHPGAFSTQPTLADRPCFLPDQAGVYTRVYFPLMLLTTIYLFGSNVRAAYRRWQDSKWDKARLSPNLHESGGFPRKVSDRERDQNGRPAAVPLPSRRSSAHLASHGMASSSSASASATRGMWRVTSRQGLASPDLGQGQGQSRGFGQSSVPPSPFGSPRPSFGTERYGYAGAGYENDDVSTLPSPAMSRRSSFIYMSSSRDPEKGDVDERDRDRDRERENKGRMTIEPGSYFLPLPSPSPFSPAGAGGADYGHGQVSQPNSPLYRRTSHSNLTQPPPGAPRRLTIPRLSSAQNLLSGPGSGFVPAAGTPGVQPSSSPYGHSFGDIGMGSAPGSATRRGTFPISASASASASGSGSGLYAGAGSGAGGPSSPVPVPILSLEHGPYFGAGLVGRVRLALEGPRAFVRSVRRARDSLLGRSAREVWAVVWVAGVVWVCVNALFFWV